MTEFTRKQTIFDIVLTQYHWLVARKLASGMFSEQVVAQEVAIFLDNPDKFVGENDPLFLREKIMSVTKTIRK